MEYPLFNFVEYVIERYARRSHGAVAEDPSKREDLKECCELIETAFEDCMDDPSVFNTVVNEDTLELSLSVEHGDNEIGEDDLFGMNQAFRDLIQRSKRLIVEPSSETKMFYTFVFDGFLKKA